MAPFCTNCGKDVNGMKFCVNCGTGVQPSGIWQAFHEFDKDRSGTLTPDELVHILRRPGGGASMSEEDANAFVAAFDRDGDGSLSFEEFSSALGQPVIFGGVPMGTWELSTAEKPPALTKTASSAKNVNEGSMDAARRRALDVVLEDGAMRNPVSGLFKALKVVPSLETALSEIGKKYPNLSPHDGVMVAMARQQFRQCMGREGVPASLTADEGAAIVLYTMEDIPREDSLYFVLNAALRSKDRKTVALWRDFIWLLMHALRKLPQPTERMLYRGLKVEPGERQPSTKEGSQQWSGFSSTSARAEVMRTFLGDSGERYLYNIEMIEPSARDIRAFSLYPDENEILLPPNFCFDIVSVYPAGDGLTLLQCKQTRTLDKILDFGEPPASWGGKWSGGGRNKAMLGVSYSINFYFTIQANGSDRAWIEGVAVPPTALEGFRRIRVRGEIDRSTNSARLEHPGKGGYTNCRFFKEGSGWRMTAEWYLPPDMSLIGGHLIPYNGTHDVSFTGDTRTTPGGVGLF